MKLNKKWEKIYIALWRLYKLFLIFKKKYLVILLDLKTYKI